MDEIDIAHKRYFKKNPKGNHPNPSPITIEFMKKTEEYQKEQDRKHDLMFKTINQLTLDFSVFQAEVKLKLEQLITQNSDHKDEDKNFVTKEEMKTNTELTESKLKLVFALAALSLVGEIVVGVILYLITKN